MDTSATVWQGASVFGGPSFVAAMAASVPVLEFETIQVPGSAAQPWIATRICLYYIITTLLNTKYVGT